MNGMKAIYNVKAISIILVLLLCLQFTSCEQGPTLNSLTSTKKPSCEFLLQVLAGEGDMGTAVVNFYAKTNNDKWLWFYVDHEAAGGGWNLKFEDDSEAVVQVYKRSELVAYYVVANGEYYLHDELHSKGEYEVIGPPETQHYPVSKKRIKD